MSELWLKKDESGDYWNYIMFAGRLQAMVLGAILLSFIVLGRQFLILWVGETFIPSYNIALFVMTAMFFSLSQAMLEISLYAQNKYTVRTTVFFISAAVNIILLPIGISWFGLMGTAYVLTFTIFFINFLVMNVYFRKTHKRMGEFNLNVIARLLPSILICSAAGVLISLINYDSFIIAALACAAALILYTAMVYFTYLGKEQRGLVRRYIKNLPLFNR